MLVYKENNLNPKNRKTGDCSTRALANILGISWENALELQFKKSLETKYDITSREVVERVLDDFGYVKIKQPRKSNGLKYRICELDTVLTSKNLKDGVLVTCAHHYTIVRGSYIEDIWNCGAKTVGNYFIKRSA